MSVPTITPREVYARQQQGQGVDIIDVRTPVEFREVHAAGVRLVPLDSLDPAAVMQARNGTAGEPLYVICKSGSRARKACEQFQAAGYHNVVCVDGGTAAWEQAGLPVTRGQKVMSLERQVRVTAGAIILLGVVLGGVGEYLGWFFHPVFYGLAAFIGAGLLYAGLSDTCGMGMMLAKMPWNQVKQECGTAPRAGCCGGK